MFALLKRFAADTRGVAAIEMAGVSVFLAFGAMSAIDVGRYASETSAVNAAAQAGGAAAQAACDVAHTPATINCTGLNSAVTTALQSTNLGASISLDGALSEGYYCLTLKGALQQVGPASAKPADCSALSNPAAGATPTLYLLVPATLTFQPLFPGLTLAQTFAPAIKRTAWMRMA